MGSVLLENYLQGQKLIRKLNQRRDKPEDYNKQQEYNNSMKERKQKTNTIVTKERRWASFIYFVFSKKKFLLSMWLRDWYS